MNDGIISDKKGVNCPDSILDLAPLTEKDKQEFMNKTFIENVWCFSKDKNWITFVGKLNKSKGFHWSNLDQCVKFSGTSDESGFIMNHVDINQHSPKLVGSVLKSLKSIQENNDQELNKNLKQNFHSMELVNDRRKDMWVASRWKHYNDFRIFIMGIKGNDEIFDDGLICLINSLFQYLCMPNDIKSFIKSYLL